MGLLRFLFIIISILWLIRIVVRIVIPMVFHNMVNKAQQQQPRQQYRRPRAPEGRIKVDYMPPRDKNAKADSVGDFIDYEEIK